MLSIMVIISCIIFFLFLSSVWKIFDVFMSKNYAYYCAQNRVHSIVLRLFFFPLGSRCNFKQCWNCNYSSNAIWSDWNDASIRTLYRICSSRNGKSFFFYENHFQPIFANYSLYPKKKQHIFHLNDFFSFNKIFMKKKKRAKNTIICINDCFDFEHSNSCRFCRISRQITGYIRTNNVN